MFGWSDESQSSALLRSYVRDLLKQVDTVLSVLLVYQTVPVSLWCNVLVLSYVDSAQHSQARPVCIARLLDVSMYSECSVMMAMIPNAAWAALGERFFSMSREGAGRGGEHDVENCRD